MHYAYLNVKMILYQSYAEDNLLRLSSGLKVVKQIPSIDALMSATSLVNLAILVLIAGAMVLKNFLVENSCANAIHALLLLAAYMRGPLASSLIVEANLTVLRAGNALVIEILTGSVGIKSASFDVALGVKALFS